MSISKLSISGYKSIESISFEDIEDFSAFAGANGAGKSNLFDAIKFASIIVERGAILAIREMGGFSKIHCMKRRKSAARTFSFFVEAKLHENIWGYELSVRNMDTEPTISEKVILDGTALFERKEGAIPRFGKEEHVSEIPNFPKDRSALMFASDILYEWLANTKIYRIDPIGSKEPDAVNTDSSQLDEKGHNVATMLAHLEKHDEIRETILEWMEIIAPGLESVATETQRLDSKTVLTFKESGFKARFPANLISDGTIYSLCILTAVLSRKNSLGLTLIEEPERGINPKVIGQLTELMHDSSTNEHPIWVSTHNETVVRFAKPDELFFVNKIEGRTTYKRGSDAADAVAGMPLDKAWLSNLFGGGLPW